MKNSINKIILIHKGRPKMIFYQIFINQNKIVLMKRKEFKLN